MPGLSGLDYEPTDWTPVDSLAWLKALAWDLRSNMDEEIDRANLEPRLTQTQLGELFPEHPVANQPIMNWPPLLALPTQPSQGQLLGRTPQTRRMTQAKPATEREPLVSDQAVPTDHDLEAIPSIFGRGEGIGSNSFAVSGRNTDTGKPYLENDPHLTATQPGSGIKSACTAPRSAPLAPSRSVASRWQVSPA